MSRLVIMGSGETAPTMVRVHRRVFADSGFGPGTNPGAAVMLDTPFGIQSNADELVERTVTYFADSVGQQVSVATWRRRDQPTMQREKTLALLQQARWAFAGPGSPTFALRQWLDTPVPAALAEVATRGGTVVMGSAAAVTLGTHAIPVYEIYKAGEDPRWVPGIDLFGTLTGLTAVVIPHYNNNEGGTHDTRFCYLGEDRLAALEPDLPSGTGVLGVDEHTALILDLEARTGTVEGNGVVTVRHAGRSLELEADTVIGFDELGAMLRGERHTGPPHADHPASNEAAAATAPAEHSVAAPTSVAESAELARADFDRALAARDVAGCVAAVLELETAIHDWSADTLLSDDSNHARRLLRSMVVRLGELAEVGARDPRTLVSPFVELLLELRANARAAKDFRTSDLVRDQLAAAGVEVRDTPDGATWVLPEV